MTYTRIGIVLGSIIIVVLIVLSITSAHALRVPLIAVVAIAVLVFGGNWMNHTLGIQRKPQEFDRPEKHAEDT